MREVQRPPASAVVCLPVRVGCLAPALGIQRRDHWRAVACFAADPPGRADSACWATLPGPCRAWSGRSSLLRASCGRESSQRASARVAKVARSRPACRLSGHAGPRCNDGCRPWVRRSGGMASQGTREALPSATRRSAWAARCAKSSRPATRHGNRLPTAGAAGPRRTFTRRDPLHRKSPFERLTPWRGTDPAGRGQRAAAMLETAPAPSLGNRAAHTRCDPACVARSCPSDDVHHAMGGTPTRGRATRPEAVGDGCKR